MLFILLQNSSKQNKWIRRIILSSWRYFRRSSWRCHTFVLASCSILCLRLSRVQKRSWVRKPVLFFLLIRCKTRLPIYTVFWCRIHGVFLPVTDLMAFGVQIHRKRLPKYLHQWTRWWNMLLMLRNTVCGLIIRCAIGLRLIFHLNSPIIPSSRMVIHNMKLLLSGRLWDSLLL